MEAIRVLLVEDDEAHAELAVRAFAAHPGRFQVTVADGLEGALAVLSGAQVDLILTDLRLRDGLGTDLLPARDEDRTIPLVVMTAWGDEWAAVDSMKAGSMDYVVKSEACRGRRPRDR